MLVSHPPWVPTSWFVFLFAVHIVLPSAYLKEIGDYSRVMKKAVNLKPSLDKATAPQMRVLSAQKNTQKAWATKRKKRTSQELTENDNEKPLAENTGTASKHGKKAKFNEMPKTSLTSTESRNQTKSQKTDVI